MALVFLVVLTTAHFKNAHLVVLALRHNGGFDSCAGHQGRSNLEFSAVADSQNLEITISWPTSAAICSTLILSPEATRYCLPPVFMTAYI